MKGLFAGVVALGLSIAPAAYAAKEPWPVIPPPVQLTPLPAGASVNPISISRIAAQIPEGRKWAKLQLTPLCITTASEKWDSEANAGDRDPQMELVFRTEIVKSGFRIAGDHTNLFESHDTTADLQIGALIKDIEARFCYNYLYGVLLSSGGAALMDIEWQVYSTFQGKVIARIPTRTGSEVPMGPDGGRDGVMRAAFAENVRALAASEEFRSIVTAPEPVVAGARASAGEPIKLLAAASAPRTLAMAADAVVAIFAGAGHGSGFLVSSDGYLLTNRHVVGDAKFVKVKWPDGAEGVGEVIRTDPGRDIALLKTDPRGRKPLALRRDVPQLGEPVFAIGTPLDKQFQGTLTRGVVSANRMIDGRNFLQSDVVVNGGNSGGPLIDDKGAVVAVTVATYRVDRQPTGINLFIPIEEALSTLNLTPTS